MINEMGSSIEFDFKGLIHGCERMINEDYPKSIFLFKGEECNFQIDYEKEIFWISYSVLEYLNDNFIIQKNIYPIKSEIIESISKIIKEDFEGVEKEFKIKFWGGVNSILLEEFYKEGKFKKELK